MASGDGKVTKAGCVVEEATVLELNIILLMKLFMHICQNLRGIKKGKEQQGQIIGYVRSTGLSTGPHLHYEVIENGKNKFQNLNYLWKNIER